MNKKLLKIVLVCVLVAAVLGGSIAGIVVVSRANNKEKLVIYNWADYMDLTVLDDFEKYYLEKTGREIEIIYSMFDTNETMMTEVTKGDSQIDLICPSEYAIQKLMSQGLLLPLNMTSAEYEYIDNIYPAVREKVAAVFPADEEGISMNDYFVPYMWGTLGILYNKEYITEEELAEEGWGILWNTGNNPALEGKILIKDSVRDVYAATVLYLKQEGMLDGTPYAQLSVEQLINTVDDTLLDMAEAALIEQRNHIKGYEVDFGKDDMINEIAYVDLAWSGDAMYAIEESWDDELDDYKLGYYVPEVGSNVWFDGWTIPATAQNIGAAKEFINFMCRPDIAMRNMIEIGYSCSVDPNLFMTATDEFNVAAIECLYENEYIYDLEGEMEEDGIYFTIGEGDDAVTYDMTEFFTDEARYPNFAEDTEGKLGVMQDFGKNNDAAVAMWEGVKGGDGISWQVIVASVGIVGGLLLIMGVVVLFKHLKMRRRPLAVTVGEEV